MRARAVGRIRSLIPGGDFGRGVATLAAGTGLSQVVVIAAAPILTRLYPPEAFGAFAVAVAIMSILISIGCFRLEFAIPLPESDEAAANVLVLALIVNAGVSAIAGLVLLAFTEPIEAWLGATALGPFLVLVAVGQLVGGTANALLNWVIRTKQFASMARNRLAASLATVFPQAALGLAGAGAPGLLIGDVFGLAVGAVGLGRIVWTRDATTMRKVTRAGLRAAGRRYRRFAGLSTPSALLNTVGIYAPLLFFVSLYGSQAGGEYALANRAISIPLALVAGAISQVFFAEAAVIGPDRGGELRRLFLRTTKALGRLGILPAIALAVLSPILAPIIFGSDWAETGIFIAILAPSFFVQFLTTATGGTLYVYERQDLQLLREVLRLGLLGGAVPVASTLGLPAVGAVVLLSLAGCITYGLYGLISWSAIVRHRRGRFVDMAHRVKIVGDETAPPEP